MVRPGSDPDTYEPKPSQMIALSNAQVYFPIKIEFENAWLDKFKDQNKKMQFVEITKNIEYIKMPEHGNIKMGTKNQNYLLSGQEFLI